VTRSAVTESTALGTGSSFGSKTARLKTAQFLFPRMAGDRRANHP
jgi:hypothetical protein